MDWRKHQQSRAAVLLAVEKELHDGLPDPKYDKALFRQKADAVYGHLLDSYFDDGASVYDRAA